MKTMNKRTTKIRSIRRVGLVMLSLLAATLSSSLTDQLQAKGAKKAAAPAAQAQQAAPTSLTWSHDLRSALTAAKYARRWVLVDCYTERCHWCKRLDADTLSNPNVIGTLGNHFVWVKCDTDDPATGQWVKEKYEPQGYPCILILDPSGREKGRILGYKAPGPFVNIVANIVRQ
ncbi:MAG: thioredoxin family protein [Cyanobacteria bacterium SZAS TMP-1]|nr:thioredoxin family protein [Cyanobacteria bacterium SZAS TMP-1]